jgi:hypothetical protein
MIIEALSSFTEFCKSMPKANFGHTLNLVEVLSQAADFYRDDNINSKKPKSSESLTGNERSLDYLMQAPPQIAQLYIKRTFEELTQKK